jgi:hypothetical protein
LELDLIHYIPVIDSFRLDYLEQSTTLRRLSRLTYNIYRRFIQEIDCVHFIGPFRTNPERLYTYSGDYPSTICVHGEKAIDVLAAARNLKNGNEMDLLHKISSWYKNAGIAKRIFIEELSDRYFKVKLEHINTHESQNLADVGYGCSQILPILVAGYHIPANSILVLSEPEIHLHPKAQAEVGSFLYDISQRGIQLIVETHSEHLLLRLQSYIASRKLKPEDVYVYYIYSKDNGKKEYKRIPLGENGYYIDDWPNGFFPEKLNEARNLAIQAKLHSS